MVFRLVSVEGGNLRGIGVLILIKNGFIPSPAHYGVVNYYSGFFFRFLWTRWWNAV